MYVVEPGEPTQPLDIQIDKYVTEVVYSQATVWTIPETYKALIVVFISNNGIGLTSNNPETKISVISDAAAGNIRHITYLVEKCKAGEDKQTLKLQL